MLKKLIPALFLVLPMLSTPALAGAYQDASRILTQSQPEKDNMAECIQDVDVSNCETKMKNLADVIVKGFVDPLLAEQECNARIGDIFCNPYVLPAKKKEAKYLTHNEEAPYPKCSEKYSEAFCAQAAHTPILNAIGSIFSLLLTLLKLGIIGAIGYFGYKFYQKKKTS